MCACGIPSQASFYVTAVSGRRISGGTETGYSDEYYCAEHVPDIDQARERLAAEGLQLLEFSVRRLRSD